MVFSLLLMVALAAGLWVATMPVVKAARTMSPAEMIEENLPPGKTRANATKPEFLAAVCGAVKKHRPDAPAITKVAVRTHHEYAGDIVATVLRCTSSLDCNFVRNIVIAAAQEVPSETSLIQDAALTLAPDCADAIQGLGDGKEVLDGKEMLDGKEVLEPPAEGPADGQGSGPIGQVPGLFGGGGGGGNPQINLLLICDNGTQRRVREDQLAAFLGSHPGSFVGTCQPTPVANP
ncbi:MAG: hypothetical protein ACR2MW_06865 [Chthoniobacterales bacterium]